MGKVNSTLNSTPDPDGYGYYASFATNSFARGVNFYVYKGVLNGKGTSMHDRCVVKAFRNSNPKLKEDWTHETEKVKLCLEMSKTFNKSIRPKAACKITINSPYLAAMDDISNPNWVMASKKKKMFTDYEYVLIEPYLQGKFQKFNTKSGWPCDITSHEAHAFSHFTWYCSGGELVVCDLQGVKSNTCYCFTDPAIHSKTSKYGPGDLGEIGMKDFFFYHKCNYICQNWPNLKNSPFMNYNPSAPCTDPPPSYEEAIGIKNLT